MTRSQARASEAAGAPRRRFLVVANPTAGINGRTIVTRVGEAMARRGAIVEIAETATIAEMRQAIARADGIDAVVAAGGDGTIRALAAEVEAAATPLGIIPIGTGNVMAREIGLGFDADAIAVTLTSGPVLDIEGARANGAPFFLMAGAGFDAEIVKRLSARMKRVAGRAAYAFPTLQVLARPLPALEVEVDGHRHTAAWVVVTRARRYGGAFVIARHASLAGGDLIAVMFKPRSRTALVRQMLALAAGRIDGAAGVVHVACERVFVRSDAASAVEIDGDVHGTTPLEITVGGPRLRLIVPDAYARTGTVAR
jgi:diacylglycerol kinase family enzyme